jgi:hypothetical protein
MNASTKRFSLWPHAILAWFVVFGSAMAAWITFAVRQHQDLVRADYYEEEIRYQEQIDRLNRTTAVRGDIAVRYDPAKAEVTLQLPVDHVARHPAGRIHFYRPSDASLDFEVQLAPDATGLQRVGVGTLHEGQWKIRAQWKAAGQDYFYEETLVLDEPVAPLKPMTNRAR